MFLRSCFAFCLLIAAAQATESSAPHSSLSVNRFVLATGIENREPSNPKENFSTSDEKVVAFVDFSAHADETVTFVWSCDDKVHAQWSAHVAASPRFRTYAIIQARPGKWSVKVQDSKGTVLKEQAFEVSQGADHASSSTKPSSAATAKLAKKITKERPKGVKEALSSLEPKNEKPAAEPAKQTAEPVKQPVAEATVEKVEKVEGGK